MSQGTQEPAPGRFAAPESFLTGLPAETAQSLLTAASDVVLLLDEAGVIRDMAATSDDIAALGRAGWIGHAWLDTVTEESRPKIEALLDGGESAGAWRQVTHLDPAATGLPVSYCVVELPQGAGQLPRRRLAFGRDLRAQAALQQRVVNAQLSMERDYWRLRDVETRYRLLLQSVGEAVLILDAGTERLEEANPAAFELLGDAIRRSGWSLADAFDRTDQDRLRVQLAGLRANGRFEPTSVRILGRPEPVTVWAASFRQDNSNRLLVRLLASTPPLGDSTHPKRLLPPVIESAPDGVVVTDFDGKVLSANRAFLDLAQLASEDLARGQSLDRWLGRSGVDLNVLVSNLRQRGLVRLFATRVRGDYGSGTEVEISAVSVPHADRPCLGFFIRDVGRRLSATDPREARELPRSVGQMKELVGRMPLKDIVRETTDLIEQLCIEAALELTGDNRASAAEMLGLSRQSLYVKLRRFGIGSDGEAAPN